MKITEEDINTTIIKQIQKENAYRCKLWLNVKYQQQIIIEKVSLQEMEKHRGKEKDLQIEKLYEKWSQYENRYVPKYYGLFIKNNHLCIASEYFDGGSIRELMNAGPIEELYISIILKQVLKSLLLLHNEGQIYDNLTASRIMMKKEGRVKLRNMGISNAIAVIRDKSRLIAPQLWTPPEVITDQEWSWRTDIWALGITAIEIACGNPPYYDVHPLRSLFLIVTREPPKLEGEFSQTFKHFVSQCLCKNAYERPTVDELLHHKFIKNAKGRKSWLKELFTRSPQKECNEDKDT